MKTAIPLRLVDEGGGGAVLQVQAVEARGEWSWSAM